MAAERCGYCGRFMATKDLDGWDTEPYCSQTNAHILADPSHWSLHVENLIPIGDTEPYTGSLMADNFTEEQLRVALGIAPQSTGSKSGRG